MNFVPPAIAPAPRRGRRSRWTEEQVVILREMWTAGHSSGVIGRCVGFSGPNVLGKAERLGLPRRGPKRWGEEMVARLKELWRDGHSASIVAGILGVTRSMVMGKVFRLGIAHGTKQGRRKPPAPRRASAFVRSTSSRTDLPTSLHLDPTPLPDDGPISAAPKTIMELQSGHCRWPVKSESFDPEQFLYCGDRAIPGLSYCLCHRLLSRETPAQTKSRKAQAALRAAEAA